MGWALLAAAAAFGAIALAWLLRSLVLLRRHFPYRKTQPAPEAVRTLYKETSGKTPDLPEVLRGVFWMSGNPAGETHLAIDGSLWDAVKRMVRIKIGPDGCFPNDVYYSWTWPTNCWGNTFWCCWAGCGATSCVEDRISYDESFRKGIFGFRAFRGCWLPCPCKWTMDDISPPGREGTVWQRGIFWYCDPCRTDYGYTLYKVLDKDGKPVQPAYDNMMRVLSGRPDEQNDFWVKRCCLRRTYDHYIQGPAGKEDEELGSPGQEDMAPLVPPPAPHGGAGRVLVRGSVARG